MKVKQRTGVGNFLDLRICDNLELIAELQSNSVDLIYCDILYGNGKDFKEYQGLKPKREIIEEHYLPRIKEMHRILKHTGSIYLQMDTKINHWLRCILDAVFGEDNFCNEIVWCYSHGGKSKKKFGRKHDVILWYTKSKNYKFFADAIRVPMKSGVSSFGGRLETDENGRKYRLVYGTKNKDGETKYYKYYLDEGKVPEDYWTDINSLQSGVRERLGYPTQKPEALLERIIKASTDEGDVVADFYAGTFTTAKVCKDLNRSFIGCDINSKCFEKAQKRGLFDN